MSPATSRYHIRPFLPADRPAVTQIQLASFFMGEPLPFPVQGIEDQMRLFTDYYLECEPDLARVLVDEQDVVHGYVLCTVKPQQQDAWRRRLALQLAWKWLREWHRYDAFTRLFYKLRLQDAWESIVNPGPPLLAHMHWNLLPEARVKLSRDLMYGVARLCAEHGIPEFGGEWTVEERHLKTPFHRVGGRVVHTVKHHTLSVLLGRPIYRITLVGRPEDVSL